MKRAVNDAVEEDTSQRSTRPRGQGEEGAVGDKLEEESLAPPQQQQAPGSSRVVRVLVGTCTARGAAQHMEDRVAFCASRDAETFAGVFDGHNGSEASQAAADELPLSVFEKQGSGRVRLVEALAECEAELMKRAVEAGTTATVALVCEREGLLTVAHLGDSRAVLCSAGSRKLVARLTTDHKPNLPVEKRRVTKAGGVVVHASGCWRVGVGEGATPGRLLAMSRSLGDFDLKTVLTAKPQVVVRRLAPKWDDFIILASDGLWDVLSDQAACDIVHDKLKDNSDCDAAARSLVSRALFLKSKDNVAAVVLGFEWSPDEEASASSPASSSNK